MQEFMLLINNKIDHQDGWSQEMHQRFLKKCEFYITNLKKNGNLIAAQPLVRSGIILSGSAGAFQEASLGEKGMVQAGYYHILAKDMAEAIAIAKDNPEFEFSKSARVEVRPIKTKEEDTGFRYPQHDLGEEL